MIDSREVSTRMKTFPVRTAEEASTDRAKGRMARVANAAARRASTLRRDFLDSKLWADLARERDLHLPPWGEPATVSNMRTWLHKTGWDWAQFEDWAGCNLAGFLARNPGWPARAIAGLVLEQQKGETCSSTTE